MPIGLVSEQKDGYLRIALEGSWGAEPLGVTSERILAECERHQALKVLFDVTHLLGHPNTLERFNMATIFATQYMMARFAKKIPACYFAVLGNEPLVDPDRFEETVASNRGLPVKTFTDASEAFQWLGVEVPGALPDRGGT